MLHVLADDLSPSHKLKRLAVKCPYFLLNGHPLCVNLQEGRHSLGDHSEEGKIMLKWL